jgi:hypothetical protein
MKVKDNEDTEIITITPRELSPMDNAAEYSGEVFNTADLLEEVEGINRVESANQARKKIPARMLYRAGLQGKHVASKRPIENIRAENRAKNKAARKTRAAQRKANKSK